MSDHNASHNPSVGDQPGDAAEGTDHIDGVEQAEAAAAVEPTTTYHLLQARLRAIAGQLQEASEQLNAARTTAFAGVSLRLAEQDRVRTDAACIPRDAICIGDVLVLASNIPPGLATQRTVGDVFSLFRSTRTGPSDWDFSAVDPADPDWFLSDPSFQRDFQEIYRYYAEARIIAQEVRGDELLMVFGIGTSDDDVRVLRWRLRKDGPVYLDAYGEHDRGAQRRYDFTWAEVGRDRIVEGRWPHYNLDDQLFVGASRGVLEFRIDDAVAGGRTILTERLAETEADVAELKPAYIRLGELVLLRLRPYRESAERFYIFNRLTREVTRVDALARGCHQLPEGQGVVFPGGFHLQNGETRVFATDTTGYELVASHHSPNGEDILYVYERPDTGNELLLAYNVVSRDMATPVACHGYALFDDGTIVCVRESTEAQRIHTVSVYESPFCSTERYEPPVAAGTFFSRVGNPELVHALGETLSLARGAADTTFNAAVFEALVARANKVADTYGWLNEPEANGLGGLLVQLRKAAGAVLDEFAAVTASKKHAAQTLADAETEVSGFIARADLGARDTDAYIELMAMARGQLGRLASLDDVRYLDRDQLALLVQRVQKAYAAMGARAIEFLDQPSSLDTLTRRLEQVEADGRRSTTAAAVQALATTVDEVGDRLVLLTEVVGALDVEDSTRKTAVLTRLSSALAARNGVRATLDARRADLRSTESAAAFTAAMAVLSQRAIASLSAVSDAAGCDAANAQITAELENCELAFGDVREFADAIAVKRDELYEAFARRRDVLSAERIQKIDRVADAALRVLDTIRSRAAALTDRSAIDGYFASDPLVTKVRMSTDELRKLGEAGRASELEVALAAARDAARRTVSDRAELFESGTVRIGRWRIGTNAEPFDLRLVADEHGKGFDVRLTGTDLVLPVDDDELADYGDLADQIYRSETPALSRAEFLAFAAFDAGVAPGDVRSFAAARLEDGYEPGVHDADAELLLQAALAVLRQDGLRYSGSVRAVGARWMAGHSDEARRDILRNLRAVGRLGDGATRRAFVVEHAAAIGAVAEAAGLSTDVGVVVDALAHGSGEAVTAPAAELAGELGSWCRAAGIDTGHASFGDLVRWIGDLRPGVDLDLAAEAAWKTLSPTVPVLQGISSTVTVTGLRSSHQRIVGGRLDLDVGAQYTRYASYLRTGLARFEQFSRHRRSVLDRMRAELGVGDLQTKVLPTFVRNRLIDEVYLPLIGDNIARQLGLNGAAQGLLLLISPPGYGKTTLVEYIADLLGFAMVKINGPSLGSAVVSLDPGAAPDRAAASELEKLNRAFAMGTNVFCYLDDIQHTSPEFLQKFISLCDATRRIDGVLQGAPRTYDMSGKRFVMVMAGNPYTSSGQAFRIPDMLANRADVHNLGDVAASAHDAFAQSYIENACGVNPLLAPVLSRSRGDLAVLLDAARGGPLRSDQLSYGYSATELSSIVKTLSHVMSARDALLRVNEQYMRSATLDDAMRGEPPFLLQGSYRNMARVAQRIVGVMTPAEVDAVVMDHYRSESQTLAASAAWNLAKLGEVLGTAEEADLRRLAELRSRWNDANVGDDPMQVIAGALRGIEASLRGPES